MNDSKIIMFVGKGGVGKTTCAAATAVHLASSGARTLALTTDAAPSLCHIFEITEDSKNAAVTPSLDVNELGEAAIRQMWDRKFGREVYEVFNSFVAVSYEEFLEFMTSVLPGLGDEFMVDYIREMRLNSEYQAIVWDTAPLGQTLALLETPAMLEKHLRLAPRIYSKLRSGKQSRETVLDILRRWEKLSAQDMDFLRNDVNFVLVTIPEALAVAQLEGIFSELDRYGLKVRRLIVNNVIKEPDSAFLRSKSEQQKPYLDAIQDKFIRLPVTELPLFPCEIKGMAKLQEVAKLLYRQAAI
ncbi:MAG: ArsA family ATPase [Dehalococcoidales bacterium]|nr:ArsA family ATPase [Dehalococcoidales bacterium]